MAYDFNDYKVKVKHPVAQGIATFAMIFIAVFAISFGVAKLLEKEPGYAAVSTYPDDEAPSYANGYTFNYYYEGSSAQIKTKAKELEEAYSSILKLSYKLLDADNEYTGYSNIAYINQHKGEWIIVSEDMYEVLKDAYEKTLEQNGYNVFAGSIYKHWESILILDEADEFDPLFNEEEANRISKLCDMTSDLSNFLLEFDDASRSVRFTVSKEYSDFIVSSEESDTILDLNLLKDAYIVNLVAKAMEEAGNNKGYIESQTGITYVLSGRDGGDYTFYSIDDENGKVKLADIYSAKASSVNVAIRHFAFTDDEIMYHVFEKDGEKYYRSPFVNATSSGFNNLFKSSYVISEEGDVVNAMYENIRLLNANESENVEEIVKNSENFVIKIY